jgi:hypothetical protein
MDKIRFIDNYELLETKVDMLIRMNFNSTLIRNIAFEINNSFI